MPVPFSPPANIDDLNEDALEAWSAVVHGWFKQAERRLPSGHRFFNVADADLSNAVPKTIPWDGFPRKLNLLLPTDLERRWEVAEQVYSQDLFGRRASFYVPNSEGDMEPVGLPFRDQDEYCEWRTVRDESNGKIKRIVFTCENPEYWYHIAEWDEPTLVKLYSELVGANVPKNDLFFHTDVFRPSFETGELQWINQNGRYNPLNKWNTTHGLVHLTHPANSLAAEVFLAADATILRQDNQGQTVTDQSALICCAGFGGPNRSSDPTIGGAVNELVRGGFAVTIADPVGLYIGDLDDASIELPGGLSIEDCWNVVRGNRSDRMILHAEFSLPEASGFEMDEVLVGGEPLQFGSQIAEHITVVIHGLGLARTDEAPSDLCEAKCCQIPSAPALLDLVDPQDDCPQLSPETVDLLSGNVNLSLTKPSSDPHDPSQIPDPNHR